MGCVWARCWIYYVGNQRWRLLAGNHDDDDDN
jgi:hypothetical protein